MQPSWPLYRSEPPGMRRDCNQGCFPGTQASGGGRAAMGSCPWCCPSDGSGSGLITSPLSASTGLGARKSRCPQARCQGDRGGERLEIRELSAAVAAPRLTPRGLLACQALEKDSGPRVYLWEKAQISQAAQGPVYSHTVTVPRDIGEFGISDLV